MLNLTSRKLTALLCLCLAPACSKKEEEEMMMTPPDMATSDKVTAATCKAAIAQKTEQLMKEGVNIAGWSIEDAKEMAEITTTVPQTPMNFQDYDGHYRPLSNHPGCSTDDLYYDRKNTAGKTPYKDGNDDGKWTGSSALGGPNQAKNHIPGDKAVIPGYPCAAKEYEQKNEDKTRPIVLLVHGNSTRPHTYEKFLLPAGVPVDSSFENVQFTADTMARDQLAEKLVAARYRVISIDLRTDVVTSVDPSANSTTQNAAGNIDHGWATPILQSLIKAVINNNPGRKISLVGHSMGVTVIRDALRRLYVEHVKGNQGAVNPFPHVQHVILGSGANHGVSTYDPPGSLCANNKTMRGTVVCEMGSRTNYVETYFHKPLNGPKDLFSTPCADGDYAFGKTGQCGGNVVKYYTITMTDIKQGQNYQDLYVSQSASRINLDGCVVNKLNTLNDYDTSGYFVKGFIANHMGSIRSEAGLKEIMEYLQE
jgi:pimeloyl-ACP methyl ester carboxylesterase